MRLELTSRAPGTPSETAAKAVISSMPRALSFAILAVLFLANTVDAVDPNRHISQYAHTAWRVQDGFEVGPSVAQTADGYLWFGTSSGLLRFDGVKFVPYALPSISPPVRSYSYLLGGRDGSLWIGTRDGLARLKDGTLQWISDPAEHSGISVILEDPEGTIWLTRYHVPRGEGPLCRVEGARLHCYGEADGIPVRYGLGLARDPEGNLWFGSSALCRWRPGSGSTYLNEISKRPDAGNGVIDVAAGPPGTIWATTEVALPGMGVLWFSAGKWANYVVPGFDGRTVSSGTLFMDREDSLWIGTYRDGVYRVRDGVGEHYGAAEGLSGRNVNLVYEDREGNIWVLTEGGIDMFRDTAVVSYSDREGLSGTAIRAVLGLRDGSLWIANERSIDILNRDQHPVLPARGAFDEEVTALFQDHHGLVWIGRAGRLFSYRNGQYGEIKTPDGQSRKADPIAAITEDATGNIWVLTTRQHLLRVTNGRLVEILNANTTNRPGGAMAADHKGGLWIASKADTLTYYKDGNSRTISLEHPESSFSVYDVFVDSDDVLLVATSNGLFRWDGRTTRVLDSRSGLPSDTVYSVIRDDENAVWVRCQKGLARISDAEFDSWRRQGNAKPVMQVLDRLDGARPLGPAYMNQPSATKSADGKLWFAATTTVQMIDPKKMFRNELAPPVYVERIIADHQEYPLGGGIKLPPLTREVQIDYTALSATAPQKVLFRYQLAGHDKVWQEAGTRRQAFYNDLAPGNYRFRVMASNNSGVWNEAGASIGFSVAAAYYQAAWFRGFCMAAVLALLWGLYQIRIRRVRRQKELLRDVINAVPANVWSTSADGAVDFVNERWLEFTGLSPGEAMGWNWEAAVHPDDRARHVAGWRAALKNGEVMESEVRVRRADGEYRWWFSRNVPLRDEKGKIVKWYGTGIDIDDRKRAEEALRQAQADLAHINRVSTLGELAASIAHELKQPIAAAITNAKTCLRWLTREEPNLLEAREGIQRVVSDNSRAAEIINRLTTFYKKGEAAKREPVDVNEVACEMVVLLHSEAARYSISMRTELTAELPKIHGDRVQLQQVFMNLMLNGIEAMNEAGGELTLKTQLADDAQVKISISDTGIGLPAEKVDQIFSTFFTTKSQGTGMGLPISRTIVEAHGGRLWATANSGRGATFHFALPTEAKVSSTSAA